MKFTYTVTITREELTQAKETYTSIVEAFVAKISQHKEQVREELMELFFSKEIKVDIKSKSKLSLMSYKLHITDSIEYAVEVEVTELAFKKIMHLLTLMSDMLMPVAVAVFELGMGKEKLDALKAAAKEFKALDKDTSVDMSVSTNSRSL